MAGVHIGTPPCDAGILMDLDPQPVSGAVAEGLAHAGFGQQVARRGVDLEPRAARPDRHDRAIVRSPHRVVDLTGASRRRTDDYGPGQVHAV